MWGSPVKQPLAHTYAWWACMQVLMVAPTAFGFNEQTAQDNHFMHEAAPPGESDALVDTVTKEFAGLHHVLSEVHGVHDVYCLCCIAVTHTSKGFCSLLFWVLFD
jgi:hypothetical protein